MPDDNQKTSPISPTPPSVPSVFPQADLPPLPPDFQNVSSTTPSDVPGTQPSGSAAPSDIPPVVSSTPKKKFGGGRIIATILGILLLVGGIGAGILVTQQPQLFQQKAKEANCATNADCPSGYQCKMSAGILDCVKTTTTTGTTGTTGGATGTGGGVSPTCNPLAKNVCQSGVATCVNGLWTCPTTCAALGSSCNGGKCCVAGTFCNNEGANSYCRASTTTGTTSVCPAGSQPISDYSPDSGSCQNVGEIDASSFCCKPIVTSGTTATSTTCPAGDACRAAGGKGTNGLYGCAGFNEVSDAGKTCSIGVQGVGICCTKTGAGITTGTSGALCISDGRCLSDSTSETCCNGTPTTNVAKCGKSIPLYCGGTGGGTITTTTGGGGGGATAKCQNIKAYDASFTLLSSTQLSALTAGANINFCVVGSATKGGFDRAKFTINGVAQAETTTQRPGSQDFCQAYTIPVGVTTFNITAQIHHITLGWK